MQFFTFLLNVLKFVFGHEFHSETLTGTEKLEIFVKQLTGNGLNFCVLALNFD